MFVHGRVGSIALLFSNTLILKIWSCTKQNARKFYIKYVCYESVSVLCIRFFKKNLIHLICYTYTEKIIGIVLYNDFDKGWFERFKFRESRVRWDPETVLINISVCFNYVISEWKRQGKPTWCGEQERPTQLQNQDMRIIQSQKTTEYSREPKQKQANGAQVTEFTVYQGRVKTARTNILSSKNKPIK